VGVRAGGLNPAWRRVDASAAMRQLTPPTNLLLTLLSAAALTLALGLAWYAPVPLPAPGADPETVEGTGATIARWFGETGAIVTGADSLKTAETVLLALAGATAGLAFLMVLPPLRRFVRELLRIVPLAAPVVVVVQMVDPPAGMEIRWGVFAALAAAVLMANSAFHGAELRAGVSSARPRRPAGGPAGPRGAR
jgi:hypothetical protein